MNPEWLATALLTEIVNSLAPMAVLALATAVLLRLLKPNASTRYAAWWLCLIGMLATLLAPTPRPRPVRNAPRIVPIQAQAAPSEAPAPMRFVYREPAPPLGRVQPRKPAAVLLLLWVAGTVFCAARLLRSYLWLRGVRRRAKPFPDAGRLLTWLDRCPTGRTVRVVVTPEVEVPLATGFLRPAILIPARLGEHLQPAETDAIVTHELAHLARRDDWAQLAERAAGALLWFHPLIRFVLARIEREREMCCDDWVIRGGAGSRSYAGSLLKLAEMRQPPALALASGAAGRSSEIGRRIEAILGNTGAAPVRISVMRLGLAAAALCVVAAGGLMMPAVVTIAAPRAAFAQVAPPAPPAPPARTAPKAAPAPKAPPAPAQSPRAVVSKERPSGFLAALNATGYGDLEVDDIINLKNNGVDASYLYQLADAGIPRLPVAELIRLRQHGVRPGYIGEFRGYDTNEVVDFHNNGVKPEMVAAIQSLGYGPYSARELVQMSQHGLDAPFFEALREYGIRQIDSRDAIRARDHGVDRKAFREARNYGSGLTIAQIIKLKSAGVF